MSWNHPGFVFLLKILKSICFIELIRGLEEEARQRSNCLLEQDVAEISELLPILFKPVSPLLYLGDKSGDLYAKKCQNYSISSQELWFFLLHILVNLLLQKKSNFQVKRKFPVLL